MPLYECVTTAGTLNEDQREQIADAITQAHCELTGAPVELVHVIFSDIPRGNSYSGGKRATPTVIRGNIRAGRSDEVRHTLDETDLRRLHRRDRRGSEDGACGGR